MVRIHHNFGEISDNLADWSRTSSKRNKLSWNGKRRLKLRSLPNEHVYLYGLYLLLESLVSKRPKIGREFRLTQRAVITLGIATLSIVIVIS